MVVTDGSKIGTARGGRLWRWLGRRLAATALVAAVALPVAAAPAGLLARQDSARGVAPAISLSDAASRVQRRYGGQIIAVAPSEQGGRRGMRVKVLLDDGRVKTLFVDERTGEVIDRRGAD
jgi:hypothetical protein